jgi:hypothetical protein
MQAICQWGAAQRVGVRRTNREPARRVGVRRTISNLKLAVEARYSLRTEIVDFYEDLLV